MTIAITGATGQLGRLVVEKLKQKVSPEKIVALVRDPAKVENLGVEARAFDYTQPAALNAALRGVDTLLLISSSELGQRVAQHANVIAAAKNAGVHRIVYTSMLHANTSPLNLAAEHIQTEADIKASGLTYTLLRNGWYTENYTASIPAALSNGAFYGSVGEGKISSAPRADYAEAAADVLFGKDHDNKVYELAGDSAYTLAELAAEISKQSGQSIPYKDIPEADYAAALKGAGLPDGLAEALASWDVGASKGGLFDDGQQLSKLLGRPTTPMSEVVANAIKP